MSDFLRLADGVRLLRRGPGEWQVGLGPGRTVPLVGDEQAVRTARRVLTTSGRADALETGLVERLRRTGLVDLESAPDPQPTGRARVHLVLFGHVDVRDPASVLRDAGLELMDRAEQADVGLLVGCGEPSRDLLDPWLRTGTTHLVVRLAPGAGAAVVGPLVEPGLNACLRCLDAHLTDVDPRWPQLVHQQAEQDARARPDGRAERVDPVLADLAVAWAVRDLTSHVEGEPPPTWSATITLPRRLSGLERREWRPHPECACRW